MFLCLLKKSANFVTCPAGPWRTKQQQMLPENELIFMKCFIFDMFLSWRWTWKSEQQDQQAEFVQLLLSTAMYAIYSLRVSAWTYNRIILYAKVLVSKASNSCFSFCPAVSIQLEALPRILGITQLWGPATSIVAPPGPLLCLKYTELSLRITREDGH